MLFNSYEFIFVFLPATIILFFYIGARGHHRVAISWLILTTQYKLRLNINGHNNTTRENKLER